MNDAGIATRETKRPPSTGPVARAKAESDWLVPITTPCSDGAAPLEMRALKLGLKKPLKIAKATSTAMSVAQGGA